MEKEFSEIIRLTPEMAQDFIALNTFEQQRALRDDHVRELKQIITDGLFLTGSIATAKLGYNGCQTILVNGQHQSHAVVECGIPIDVTYEQYTVDSPEDLSLLYRQFDNHRARSLSDIVKPEAQALGLDWPLWVSSIVVTGAIIREGRQRISKQHKVSLLKKYRRVGEFIANILGPTRKHVTHLAKGPVIASMILTWERHHEDAYRFWAMVRDGEHLTRKMPAYKLREYLSTHTVRGNTVTSNQASDREIISRCITAWNAFRRGQTTELRYYADKPIPKAA